MARYDLIYKSEDNPLECGAPVALRVATLFFDNQDNKKISLLKFENLSEKAISSLKVRLKISGNADNMLLGPVSYHYSNINAGNGALFGDKEPIPIPANAKSVNLDEMQVLFTDGTFWNSDSETVNSSLTSTSVEEPTKAEEKDDNAGKKQKAKKFNNQKDGTLLLTILSVLLGILIFVNGYFKYDSTFSLYWEDKTVELGSFSFLVRYTGVQLLFDLIILTALSAVIVFAWIQHSNGKHIGWSYTICSAVAFLTMAIGTIIGCGNFYYYNSQYSPKLELFLTFEYEYKSLSFLFFVNLLIAIALLSVSVLKDLNKLKGNKV